MASLPRNLSGVFISTLFWLLEKGPFNTNIACNMDVEVASLNKKKVKGLARGDDSVDDYESDEEAVQVSVEGAATHMYIFLSAVLFNNIAPFGRVEQTLPLTL